MFKRLNFSCFSLFAALACVAVSALPETTLQSRDDNLPARVPYRFPPPGNDPVADSFRARRTNGTLLDLDGVLLDSPSVALTWNAFFGVIRDNNTLPADMREMFILRIAALNNAAYVWLQHEPVGRSVGLTTPQLRAIRLTPPFSERKDLVGVLGSNLTVALGFVDYITKSIHVPNQVFNKLSKILNTQQLVDAVATTGGYALVSRFVVALNVDDKMDVPVPIPA